MERFSFMTVNRTLLAESVQTHVSQPDSSADPWADQPYENVLREMPPLQSWDFGGLLAIYLLQNRLSVWDSSFLSFQVF